MPAALRRHFFGRSNATDASLVKTMLCVVTRRADRTERSKPMSSTFKADNMHRIVRLLRGKLTRGVHLALRPVSFCPANCVRNPSRTVSIDSFWTASIFLLNISNGCLLGAISFTKAKMSGKPLWKPQTPQNSVRPLSAVGQRLPVPVLFRTTHY